MIPTDIALAYQAAGLSVLPAIRAEKRPALAGGWKAYQSTAAGEAVVRAWFTANHDACCLVCGAVSQNLEMLDFDFGGELFSAWSATVDSRAPGLLERLVAETSPSGGWHVAYRCEESVSGNLKLAQREIVCPNADPIEVAGKQLVPRRRADGAYHVVITLIETRGEGGIFLCAPTPGYELVQGTFAALPVLTAAEREILLVAAWELNEAHIEVVNGPTAPVATSKSGLRPGDDFNARGDIRPVLEKHGWTSKGGGENEKWLRPGGERKCSATFNGEVFYNFSSNAHPFEPMTAYSPFAVYTMLEHGGDFGEATKSLATDGYGEPLVTDDSDVDVSAIVAMAKGEVTTIDDDAPPVPPGTEDPGALPDHLFDVPGFIGELAAYTMDSAPYPNRVLAFAGALSMQSYLCGRRVRDRMNNRSNIYLVALANSGVGKDHPRQVNSDMAYHSGVLAGLADSFASGEGIEDAMYVHHSMLFQTDEIDAILGSINRSKEARNEMMMQILLKMYSAARARYPLRKKAGQTEPLVVHQPSLTLYGTAVPEFFYKALSGRMLNNGLFARTLILDAGPRSRGRIPPDIVLPAHLVETAKWWAQFNPGGIQAGNLSGFYPDPITVPDTAEATARTQELWALADDAYAEAENAGDDTKMAIWARAFEKTRKLALLYACSENHEDPRITRAALDWAWEIVEHQTRKMLFMADLYVADSDFEADCKRLVGILTKWRAQNGDTFMAHWDVSRRLGWAEKKIDEVRESLVARQILDIQTSRRGPTRPQYRLRA